MESTKCTCNTGDGSTVSLFTTVRGLPNAHPPSHLCCIKR